MASLMENLIDTLEKESSEYEVLLDLSEKKTPVIVKGDLEALEKITDEEQDVAGRIHRLEQTRIEVTGDIANVINRDVETLKLKNLIQMLEGRPEEQARLQAVHDKLKTVVHKMQEVNERNRDLISHAMELISFDMNLLQAMKTAPETANYNKGAYNAGDVMGTGQNGFDAKQ